MITMRACGRDCSGRFTGEKHTKTGRKERPTEAPLRLLVLLFFYGKSISGKPVAALIKLEFKIFEIWIH
jgi:hypothetical protein